MGVKGGGKRLGGVEVVHSRETGRCSCFVKGGVRESDRERNGREGEREKESNINNSHHFNFN